MNAMKCNLSLGDTLQGATPSFTDVAAARKDTDTGKTGMPPSPRARNRSYLFLLVVILLALAELLLPIAQVPGGAPFYLALMAVLLTSATVCLLG